MPWYLITDADGHPITARRCPPNLLSSITITPGSIAELPVPAGEPVVLPLLNVELSPVRAAIEGVSHPFWPMRLFEVKKARRSSGPESSDGWKDYDNWAEAVGVIAERPVSLCFGSNGEEVVRFIDATSRLGPESWIRAGLAMVQAGGLAGEKSEWTQARIAIKRCHERRTLVQREQVYLAISSEYAAACVLGLDSPWPPGPGVPEPQDVAEAAICAVALRKYLTPEVLEAALAPLAVVMDEGWRNENQSASPARIEPAPIIPGLHNPPQSEGPCPGI